MSIQFRSERLRQLLMEKDPERGRQSRLARALGVSEAIVSEWLAGRKSPGGQMLVDLAAYLGTTAEDLLPPTVQNSG
jgi:transcriptional regulator with XRE-family HTH domain